jgi:hypothetical protein
VKPFCSWASANEAVLEVIAVLGRGAFPCSVKRVPYLPMRKCGVDQVKLSGIPREEVGMVTTVESSLTDITGPRRSSRPLRPIRSANGSIRTAMAATICWRSRRAASRDRGLAEKTGLPLHFDNQSVFKERIWRDRADPNVLHDEITTFDHALTRPWTVDKKYGSARIHRPEYYTAQGKGRS